MPICPHCHQPVRSPVSRCNRCDWSPLDEQIQTLPLTAGQRVALLVNSFGWLVIIAIIVIGTLFFSSVGLGVRAFVVLFGAALGWVIATKMVGPARQDLAQGTLLRRPLPLVGHSVERTEEGHSYHARFGDVLTTTLSQAQHAALVPGEVYWVSYSPHSQRVWDIQPYQADGDAGGWRAG
ncbi:MAG TPA: hypothetical protein VGE07_13310 [Herpetosiphonaceae bacterium]